MKEQNVIADRDNCPSKCEYQEVPVVVVPHNLIEEPLELIAPLSDLCLYLLLNLLLMK